MVPRDRGQPFLAQDSARTSEAPYHNDYHRWNHGETVYYNQWVVETHRDNRDFRHLDKDQQREYWNWRHDHH